jgi:hypothetical protein
VSLQAQQCHRNLAGSLPRHWRPEARHTNSTGGGNYERREAIGIPQPLGVDRGELDQIVIERGAHEGTR